MIETDTIEDTRQETILSAHIPRKAQAEMSTDTSHLNAQWQVFFSPPVLVRDNNYGMDLRLQFREFYVTLTQNTEHDRRVLFLTNYLTDGLTWNKTNIA